MLLCDRIKLKFTARRRKLLGDYSFFIANKISSVNVNDWKTVNSSNNLFLSIEYLTLLEVNENENYHFKYVIVYKKNIPVAISYFQVIDFSAALFGEFLAGQMKDLQSKRSKLFETYLQKSKGNIVLRLVTLGNNFVSGEHGIAFSKTIDKEHQFQLINKLAHLISKEEKLHGKISATLVKDFYSKSLPARNELKTSSFIEFAVEPNMVVEVPMKVKNMTDYLGLFSKKYRNRAKNIFNLSQTIQKRELDVNEIQKLNSKIFFLYEQVYNNAKFKLVKLDKNYFSDAKKTFGEKFIFFGFFKNQKLVAFNSAFLLENEELEAHFIGFDYSLNKDFGLYQNILFNLIDTAIKYKRIRVNLGRTAAEIKSTVGAKAELLTCYLKPQNTLSKVVMGSFLNFLSPSEWIPRNPFKEKLV